MGYSISAVDRTVSCREEGRRISYASDPNLPIKLLHAHPLLNANCIDATLWDRAGVTIRRINPRRRSVSAQKQNMHTYNDHWH